MSDRESRHFPPSARGYELDCPECDAWFMSPEMANPYAATPQVGDTTACPACGCVLTLTDVDGDTEPSGHTTVTYRWEPLASVAALTRLANLSDAAYSAAIAEYFPGRDRWTITDAEAEHPRVDAAYRRKVEADRKLSAAWEASR